MKSATILSESGLTPAEVAARCVSLPEAVFFDSALEHHRAISLVAACPDEIVEGRSPADWERLRKKVAARQRDAADDGAPRGMAAGYVEYDGAFRFAFYENLLLYRHADQTWAGAERLIARMADSPLRAVAAAPHFTAEISRAKFCEMVRRAQSYIAAGDIYQVNLAQRFSASWRGDPWAFYEALRHYSPAPHAAFLRAGARTILSASPECFLQISGRHIRTRPIKGTRPRRAGAGADEKSALELITSPKEIAELVMITDLERNDLGRLCEFGTVRVRELLKLERYEQVFHLVSTIEGVLRTEVDPVTALQTCLPGGSITGAPKKRAREIIAELEPVSRGLYTGAIGYFGFNGESQFSIAIRTAVIKEKAAGCGVAHFHVGAGIVADSVPEKEHQETLDKAAGILLAAERM